jgi:hypothetical protein
MEGKRPRPKIPSRPKLFLAFIALAFAWGIFISAVVYFQPDYLYMPRADAPPVVAPADLPADLTWSRHFTLEARAPATISPFDRALRNHVENLATAVSGWGRALRRALAGALRAR